MLPFLIGISTAFVITGTHDVSGSAVLAAGVGAMVFIACMLLYFIEQSTRPRKIEVR